MEYSGPRGFSAYEDVKNRRRGTEAVLRMQGDEEQRKTAYIATYMRRFLYHHSIAIYLWPYASQRGFYM